MVNLSLALDESSLLRAIDESRSIRAWGKRVEGSLCARLTHRRAGPGRVARRGPTRWGHTAEGARFGRASAPRSRAGVGRVRRALQSGGRPRLAVSGRRSWRVPRGWTRDPVGRFLVPYYPSPTVGTGSATNFLKMDRETWLNGTSADAPIGNPSRQTSAVIEVSPNA